MLKIVDASEFLVSKRTVSATKLSADDRVVFVKPARKGQQIVLQSKNGYFLRFSTDEVPEKKKTAIGVRGIKLKPKDTVEAIYLFEEGVETKVSYKGKEVSLNRLKQAKRDTAGIKNRGA